MAFAFIAPAAATSIIDKVVGTAYSFVEQNLFPASDKEALNMEAELERLKAALPKIKAALSLVDSGTIKNKNEALASWLWQFRDVVESADDVLDEIAYYKLEEEIQSRNEKVGPSDSSLKRKLSNSVNHNIGKRLSMAVKGLEKVASRVQDLFCIEERSSGFRGKNSEDRNVGDDRETGSMITESVVFGREAERASIVEWLTVGGETTLSAFTIYGIGGFGKTTLAQLIHKDDRVNGFFDPIIWVCVSDQFDAVTIIVKILEVMSNESPKVRSLTSLQNVLKERLISKRFLLVLDDVWNDENRYEWEKLVAPLKFGNKESKILVTTRMESVVNMVGKVIEGKTDCLKLEGLEEKEFFRLFNKHAFHGVDTDEFENLHPIGNQIAKKLGGCPLAAKVMGGVLNYSIEFEYWNKVLKEDVPDFEGAKDAIMAVLRLSYNHLPTYLQLCFRYCSIFYKDYIFQKHELIKMWMGSGLIENGCKRQMPEDVGDDYFNRLLKKSFFDLKYEDCYVMHDLLHDLAQSISEGECLRIERISFDMIPETIRHLSFSMDNLLDIRKISHLKNLRTLYITFRGNHPNSDDIREFGEVLKRHKSLHLLKITLKNSFKVPDAIGELIHLRYLSLGFFGKKNNHWFPQSVFKLYHLELIEFSSIVLDNIEEHEASNINNLVNLRYLDVGSKIVTKIPFIGKLTYLQELKSFHIKPHDGYMISELGDLRTLRKLDINNLTKVNNPLEAKEAKLKEKENLNSLSLCWSNEPWSANSRENFSSPTAHEQLVDNLQPHSHLRVLEINGYGGMRSPSWMTHSYLVNLIYLELVNCFLLKSLPALGKLLPLKNLRLENLPQVKKIDNKFYGNIIGCGFPGLEKLELYNMQELEDWDEVQGMILFPRLRELVVSNCPKLRSLPSLPSSLNHFDIQNVGLESLPKLYSSSLSYLKVQDCPNLTSLNGCMLQLQQEHIQALPSRGFIDFTSLKCLHVINCPKLVGTPGNQENLLPSSLLILFVGNCGFDVTLLKSVQNLTLLTTLHLNGCLNISYTLLFEILATPKALNRLSIWNCPELSSLSGLEALTSLKYLSIENCEKLTTTLLSQPPLSANADPSSTSTSIELNWLCIDHASLLLLEPLRNQRLTKQLNIDDASDLTCLPEEWLLQNHCALRRIFITKATSLELLSSCMDKLQLLEGLYIYGALLIQSLPDLPSSLKVLYITGCHPVLKERYQKDTGTDWHKISFIEDVEIE